jgi:hypothetical protein
MSLRTVVTLAALCAAGSASAGELAPLQAKQFVAGKIFEYTCFEGTTGVGRINHDGSVVGSIRMKGTGQARFVRLPANTVQVTQSSICASVSGMSFTPCFNVVQLDGQSFRGAVNGFGFAYCNFVRRTHHADLSPPPAPSKPRSIAPTVATASSTTSTPAPEIKAELRTSTYTEE